MSDGLLGYMAPGFATAYSPDSGLMYSEGSSYVPLFFSKGFSAPYFNDLLLTQLGRMVCFALARVERVMRTSGHDLEVFYAVVHRVSVDMMNVLRRQKPPSKMLFHQPAGVWHTAAFSVHVSAPKFGTSRREYSEASHEGSITYGR